MACSIGLLPRHPGRRALLVGVILAMGAYMTFGCVTDRLLLHPPADVPASVPGAVRMTVPFRDSELEVFTARSPGAADAPAAAVVLEFTGNAATAQDMIEYAAWRWGELPVEAWVVNYPGFGGSPGSPRLAAMADAGLVAFDAAAAHAAGRPVIVAGISIGTTVALHVAANRPAAGVLLYNPPALRQLILRDYGWWNLWLLAGPIAAGVPSSLDSIANARRVWAPAVFILAGEDRIVPPWNQSSVVDAFAGTRKVITLPGRGHNDLPSTPQELRQTAEQFRWLFNQIGIAGPVEAGGGP